MSKSVLLHGGWEWKKGKEYLNNAHEDIEIEKFSYEYFKLVDDFHHWLYKELRKLHKVDLDWLNEKSSKLRSLLDIVYRDK